jgi:hypothetical protein
VRLCVHNYVTYYIVKQGHMEAQHGQKGGLM